MWKTTNAGTTFTPVFDKEGSFSIGCVAIDPHNSLVVWVGTQFALPVSISQCLLGGMLGAAYSRTFSAVNRSLVAETLALWLLAPITAFGLAYALGRFF